jgi:hypothetical protein
MFGDLVVASSSHTDRPSQPDKRYERLRPGVGIDRGRRAALENVLYLTETTDQGLVFRGAIHGRWHATPLQRIEPLVGLLLAGLGLTTRWGGGSSRGLGWAQVRATRIEIGAPYQQAPLIEKVRELCPSAS